MAPLPHIRALLRAAAIAAAVCAFAGVPLPIPRAGAAGPATPLGPREREAPTPRFCIAGTVGEWVTCALRCESGDLAPWDRVVTPNPAGKASARTCYQLVQRRRRNTWPDTWRRLPA